MKAIVAVLFLFCCFMLSAQRTTIEDFIINGDTYLTEEQCFRLTGEYDYSSGSIWYREAINLKEPFSVDLKIMLGCQDDIGADGMVFVMTPQINRLGFVGEGIGFSGLIPSVGVEIDTWLNEHLRDPVEDHLSIMLNGRVGHWNDLAGPVTISNIEDCARHLLSIHWMPRSNTLSIAIDNKQIISTQYDLIEQVFKGDPVVYWGITAATGRYNNIHEVCFDRMAVGDIPNRSNLVD